MTLDYLADNEDLERYNDVFLTREDIQSICSPDTLAALFTKLHYATDTRLEQTPTTLDITSERLRAAIKYIERIAYHHDFEGLAIYLFELRSLTVAIRTELVQNFRKFNEKVLLVLTTEGYERLDFVLLEPYIPTVTYSGSSLQTPSMFGNQQANFSIRPHVLQVARRNPDEVALRVLRRFTYTEGDDVAQYDKLLNAYIIATWSEIYFNNRGLFSDYYLNQRLPELQEWKDTLEVAALRKAHRQLRQLYEDAREAYSGKPETILRKQLLEPIFAILGFNAQRVPAANKRKFIDASLDDTLPVPDYHLFLHGQAATEKSRALCLTYCWGRNLDGKDDSRDQARPENPGAVAVTLLDAGEADWVIVTNGIVWRLYAAKAHSRSTNYYEINLLETLELDPAQREKAFRYYWLFFRERAFASIDRSVAGEPRSLSLLDFLLIESEQHARALGERLKNRVFEDIFPYFAQGFVNNARQRGLLPPHLELLSDEERNRLLEPYFTGTLTFLYRLLFLLYAESRDLLPVRQEHGYYEHSLERLKQQIKKDAGDIQDQVERNLKPYSETKTDLYQRLWFLFEAIDKGKPELNVPAYNGGLFITEPPAQKEGEPAEIIVARFLKEHMIPDRQLALGLDRMARDIDEEHEKKSQAAGEANEHSHALVFIDYKSLGVRHLGSIYEGLLEFKLRVAPTEMAVVEGKRTEEVLPYEEAKRTNRKILKIRQDGELKERVIGRGSTYLENDRRERKATGSYYTPDYIVEYIVEQTVGPLLKMKLEALRPVFREVQQYLEQRRNLLKSLPHGEVSPENETYKHFRFSLIEAFFDMKVLDPAMGSGHFLVQVVDFITDQMAKWLRSFKWNPIVYELALTRQKIDEEMKQQKVTIDLATLTDLNLLKRRVLKSCIYGVDINPMAVELAKIGLWLDCFTIGAPLSFLDHHIKPGNSLLGASVQKVHKHIKDNLFGYQFQYLLDAAQMMRDVSKRSDSTVKELVESQNAYQHAYEALRPYKRLFNVWLSHYFGNQSAQEITGQYAEAIVNDNYSNVENASDIPLIQQVCAKAELIAQEKLFFHWELEFPEVYFDESSRKEDGGFDVILGNPPYVRQERFGVDKPALSKLYDVFNTIADLYTYFIEQGHIQIRPNGRFSMITSNKFMRANYGAALRKFLTRQVKLETLIDFGELRVFGDATPDPMITVSAREAPSASLKYVQVKHLKFSSLHEVVASSAVLLQENAWQGSNWSLASGSQQTILDKIQENMTRLGIYSNNQIKYGIKTGYNEAFVIDQATRERLIATDPKSAEIIKPFLVGDDVRRYHANFKDQYLIWSYVGIPIDKYPAIYEHLQQYQGKLEKRWDKGKYWWELRHCDYYADFEKPKIIYPDISMSSRFVLDRNAYYTINTTYIIPIDDIFLLALLNSELMWLYLKRKCTVLGDIDEKGRLRLFSTFIESLPVRRINFVTTTQDRATYLAEAKSLSQQYLNDNNNERILAFVRHHLSQEPEASDVVRDLLAYLAEEMLLLNEKKQAMQKDFLHYLTDALHAREKSGKAGLEDLAGKNRLLNYPGDYRKEEPSLAPDALWEIIVKNRSRIGARPSPTLKANILAKYEPHQKQIDDLKECLKRTDNLIDQIVYRLYGLTEDEISVVEEKS